MLKIASETDRFEKFWGTGFRLLPGGVLHPSPNFPSLRLAYNIPPPTYIFLYFWIREWYILYGHMYCS